jgi:hypothetical protein
MALGDFTSDQTRYAAAVAAGTGLDVGVVKSWIGSESGWGVTKASHNYLNVGPGQQFTSVDQAAAKVVELINTSSRYGGIKAAIPAGPVAQAKAIQASPWDAGHYAGDRLLKVYGQLTGAPVAENAGIDLPNLPKLPSWLGGFDLPNLPNLGSLPDPQRAVGAIVTSVIEAALPLGLSLIFSTAALGVITLGLLRLTGQTPKSAATTAAGLASGVGTAQTVAAVAAN